MHKCVHTTHCIVVDENRQVVGRLKSHQTRVRIIYIATFLTYNPKRYRHCAVELHLNYIIGYVLKSA